MKKIFTLALAASMVWLSALAVPAKRVTSTFTQSDGTTITVTKQGDEFHHSYVTSDGLTVVRDAQSGDFYYQSVAGKSSVLAHNASDRSAAENAYISTNSLSYGDVRNAALASNAVMRARANAVSKVKFRSQVPHSGTVKVPVILVQYTDVKFKDSDPQAVFDAQQNTSSESVKKYFTDQSDGQFVPDFDVLGPVTLSQKQAYYGGNDSNGDDLRPGEMVAEACDLLDSSVDFSIYDNDKDGYVDVVYVIYAGLGEASADNADNTVWPHQWDLTDAIGSARTYDGVKVDKYACGNELEGNDIDGIGTFCHEFSHCLGLPDFYDVNYKNFGMDAWSLLDYGCYNNDGKTPCAYTAYEREFMGWITIPTLQNLDGTVYTLEPQTTSKQAYRVQNDASSNEYYVLEYRDQSGWNRYDVAKGLMVSHVDYSATVWENNTVNTSAARQRMTILAADNSYTHQSISGDLFPYNKVDSLTNNGRPKAVCYTGSTMNKPIYDIAFGDNNTMTFRYGKLDVAKPTALEVDSADLGDTSFLAKWTKVDDAVSYTLRVRQQVKGLLLANTFDAMEAGNSNIASSLDSYMETTGWTGTNLYPEDGGIRLGTSKNVSSLVTPVLNLTKTNGVITVAVTAKAYTNVNGTTDSGAQLVVSVGRTTDATTASKTNSVAADEQEFVFTLIGDEGENYVRFANAAAKKRVVITDIKIYEGDVTADLKSAPLKAVNETRSGNEILVTGITDTTYNVTGLTANTAYQYDVKAVYANDVESDWSNAISLVTLEGPTGAADMVFDDSQISLQGRTLTVLSAEPQAVYSVAGVKVAAKAAGTYELEPGIYVVKVGAAARKLIVK